MAKGKPRTEEEIALLKELAGQGYTAHKIYESGRLPVRTYEAIRKQLNLCSLVSTNRSAIVETIARAARTKRKGNAKIKEAFIRKSHARFMKQFLGVCPTEKSKNTPKMKEASLKRLAHLIKVCSFLL